MPYTIILIVDTDLHLVGLKFAGIRTVFGHSFVFVFHRIGKKI